jgi:2-amino-4-hydroxy-6-hydroxymethyldihydropteridine diphosphokinase
MSHSIVAYIGLGSNLGESHATLARALAHIAALPGIDSCEASPFYRSAPVQAQGPDFVNAVARIATTLTPLELLGGLQGLETAYGRVRTHPNAPRTLDLDLLLYGQVEMDEPRLVLPHPRMHERAFVLRPLADLAPGMHLKQGSVADLLKACSQQAIERYTA